MKIFDRNAYKGVHDEMWWVRSGWVQPNKWWDNGASSMSYIVHFKRAGTHTLCLRQANDAESAYVNMTQAWAVVAKGARAAAGLCAPVLLAADYETKHNWLSYFSVDKNA